MVTDGARQRGDGQTAGLAPKGWSKSGALGRLRPQKPPLFDLLNAEAATGIKLTENNAMFPASSVSGHYFNHPDSKYFAVGKLAKDQIEDYSIRKTQPVLESEKWLAPYLDY